MAAHNFHMRDVGDGQWVLTVVHADGIYGDLGGLTVKPDGFAFGHWPDGEEYEELAVLKVGEWYPAEEGFDPGVAAAMSDEELAGWLDGHPLVGGMMDAVRAEAVKRLRDYGREAHAYDVGEADDETGNKIVDVPFKTVTYVRVLLSDESGDEILSVHVMDDQVVPVDPSSPVEARALRAATDDDAEWPSWEFGW